MRQNFKTAYYKHERAQAACDEYTGQLRRLFSDEDGYRMLEEHENALDEEVENLRKLHDEAKHLPEIIRQKKMDLLDRQIGTLYRAIRAIETHPDHILKKLRESAQPILEVLKNNGRGIFSEHGKVADQYVETLYSRSRDETKERYAEMDYWYAVGQEKAIEKKEAADRAYELTLIPKPIKYAKWKFMLTLADVAFNISYDPAESENKGELHNTLLARLLGRLSMHERGADNEHMPFSHKLRHNPAIHSLHVVALADKIFHQARKKIESGNGGAKSKEALLGEWRKLRNRVMLMALVHDMGELDGELSQGIERSRMTEAQIQELEKTRQEEELTTFKRHLTQRRSAVNVPDTQWYEIQKQYLDAFQAVENTDIFIGRFVKALERIQSQQDYLRFEGLNDAPKLDQADERNKEFTLNYVSKVLYDASYNQNIVGPKALVNLAANGNNDKSCVFHYLCEAVDREYQVLIDTLQRAFNVPVISGGIAHKMVGSKHSAIHR